MLTIRNYLNTPLLSTAEAVGVEEGGRRPAAGDGEAGAREEPAHTRTEEDPQRGSVEVQQPPGPQRQVPAAHAARQGWLQRGA